MPGSFKVCSPSVFKATLHIQANPYSNVSCTCQGKTYSGTANDLGIVDIIVRKRGTYTIVNSSGSTVSASIVEKQTYNINCVYVGGLVSADVSSWKSGSLIVHWVVPNSYVSGVVVVRTNDSSQRYTGLGNDYVLSTSQTVKGYIDSNLTIGTTYYYRIDTYYDLNGTRYWNTGAFTGGRMAQNLGGYKQFSSTQTWIVPSGCREITVFAVGGGGGGGDGYKVTSSNIHGGGGGGGGYTSQQTIYNVVPGQSYYVTVGSGGSGAMKANPSQSGRRTNATDGGTSNFGGIVIANGGKAGGVASFNPAYYVGGNGGSGGGQGGYSTGEGDTRAGAGGTNGSDGGYSSSAGYQGIGQHTTTEFTFNGTTNRYGGGGGGGAGRGNTQASGGSGGGGSGANYTESKGHDGEANTGGGGGGGCGISETNGGNGGSGTVIVVWS